MATTTFRQNDSYAIENFIPEDVLTIDFEALKSELEFQPMVTKHGSLVPRLVAIQGTVNSDGSAPLYRHPISKQPDLISWTPTVKLIRDYVAGATGDDVNHSIIQYYRDGNDHIGEHSDKTLDILKNSCIYNFSVGATRKLKLRAKFKKEGHDIFMKHNSLFCLGWETNRTHTHRIDPDKRPADQKSDDENAFNGERISFTFRQIATFTNAAGEIIGQGSGPGTADDMGQAFYQENVHENFSWDEYYGKGFNARALEITLQPQ